MVLLVLIAIIMVLLLVGMFARPGGREGWGDAPGPSSERRYRIPFAHFGGVPNSSQLWGPMTHSTP